MQDLHLHWRVSNRNGDATDLIVPNNVIKYRGFLSPCAPNVTHVRLRPCPQGLAADENNTADAVTSDF
eukprot:scaffold9383_cov34-Prasinocladus_malaysianus.AAC.1